jgi:4-amino-4-deoxy-L-arabinose transferase-like glycosyltransferase
VNQWSGAIVWYAIVGGLACFWRQGATGLVSMEGMLVDGARHMLRSGDWIVPRVYGEIYSYKPALGYWLAAIPQAIFDSPSAGQIRFPFAVSGFVLGLAILILIGRLAGARIGLFTALASTTGFLFLQKVRIAEFDMALVAGVGMAIVAACHNLSARQPRWVVWVLAYLGLAAGFLAKGAPSLMAYGPGVLVAALATGRFRRLFEWRHLSAALLFPILIGGYLWAAYASEGARAFDQPLLEAKVRGLGWIWGNSEEVEYELAAFRESAPEGEIAGRPGRILARTLVKPLFILAVCLPWSVLAPAAFRRRRGPREESPESRLVLSARAFLIAGALAFMITNTHEMRYYLPLCVPVGILCGVVAGGGLELDGRWRRGLFVAAVVIAAIFALGTALAGVFLPDSPHRPALVAAGVAAVLSISWIATRPVQNRIALVLTIAALCALASESLGFRQLRARKRVLAPQAMQLKKYLPEGIPIWIQGPADIAGKSASLYFYLGHPVLAFRPAGRLPPPGSYCLLSSDRIDELNEPPGFVFDPIARAGHPSRDYLLGTCSWLIEEQPFERQDGQPSTVDQAG